MPFSGQPITTGACVGNPNTWFYTEAFTENTDVLVTLNSVTRGLGPNAGVTTALTAPASNPYKYTIPANGSLSLPNEQCIGTPSGGMIQHTYNGTDFNGQPVTIAGHTVTFLAK